jgi:hypothetical protein
VEVVTKCWEGGASKVIMMGLPKVTKEAMEGLSSTGGDLLGVRAKHPRREEREQIIHIVDSESKQAIGVAKQVLKHDDEELPQHGGMARTKDLGSIYPILCHPSPISKRYSLETWANNAD